MVWIMHKSEIHTKNFNVLDEMMMLEADVLMGTLTGGGTEQIPIMAHPPALESDLSLQNFLDGVVAANTNGKRKGIKLDFKALAAVPLALEMLGQMSNQVINLSIKRF
jgi:Uncharacterized conserved protein (DUF2181)